MVSAMIGEIFLRPLPRNRLFCCIYIIEISNEQQSLVIRDQSGNRIVKGLAGFTQPGERCPRARGQGNSLLRVLVS
ncbi:MAG: hypothetical protein WC294_07230 [Methanoregula sp.]|jgi:hypothetical protein